MKPPRPEETRAGNGSLKEARETKVVSQWAPSAPLPVQSKNRCLSYEPGFPNPQFLTDCDPRPDEIWGEKLDGHDARLARPQQPRFTQIEATVKEIPIDAQRATPPPGWRRPCSSTRIRWKQPQFDNGIRRPKCHSASFKQRMVQLRTPEHPNSPRSWRCRSGRFPLWEHP